ncbi:MAG: hypothetical protein SGILL_005597 [Bacillariaceae sp.]
MISKLDYEKSRSAPEIPSASAMTRSVVSRDMNSSLMEEGGIFTHDEGSKEDETTEGSISMASSETESDTNSDTESRSSSIDDDSDFDVEKGNLSFGSIAKHQMQDSSSDPDVMKRAALVGHEADNSHTEEDRDVEKGIIISNSIDTDAEKKKCPWSIILIVGIMIALLIGGGVAATLVFLRQPSSDVSPTEPPSAISPSSAPMPSSPTPSPNTQPTGPTSPPVAGIDNVETFIASSLASVGGAGALQDPNSPQSMALDWLLENELLEDYEDDRLLQRYTMAVLFYSSNGEAWSSNDGWLTDQDECTWYSSESETSICTEEGLVDEFDLDNNNVGGTLPWTEFGMLSNQLRVVDFFENQVTGILPSQIGLLTSLLAIDIYSNRLSGSLPTDLGSLTTLQFLGIDENFLTGSIPTQLAEMDGLETLSLRNNILSGTVPTELGQMTNLKSLFLTNNFLSGSMPAEICSLGLDNLEVNCDAVTCDCCTSCGGDGSDDPLLDFIAANSPDKGAALQDPTSPQSAAFQWLSRPINEGFSNSRMLQRYALATLYYATGGERGGWTSSSLWLTGSDECKWFTSSKMDSICINDGAEEEQYLQLDLRQNGLEGSLPPEVSMLSMLETLRLPGNSMTGSLPAALGDMTRLEYLDLASNKFVEETPPSDNIFGSDGSDSGVLFSRIGDMTSLTHLSLFENMIETIIPTSLGLLTNRLRVLDLGSNLLFGTVPSELGRLTNLVGISVFDNALSGSIPDEFSELLKLETLYIDSNDLGPPIPLGLCQVTTLKEFWSDCEEVGCVCCTTCCSDGFGCVAV